MIIPLKNFFSLPLVNILFGFGNVDYASQFITNEIGIIRLAMKIGVVLILMVGLTILRVFLKSLSLYSFDRLRIIEKSPHYNDYQIFKYLSLVNIMIVIFWMFSTLHYLVIFRVGAVQLIAFQFSVAFISLYKSESIYINEKKHLSSDNPVSLLV